MPVTVIGYTGDETTGAEILADVAECRKSGCKDAVRELIERQERIDQVVVVELGTRLVCRKTAP